MRAIEGVLGLGSLLGWVPMDAHSSDHQELLYSDQSPVLVAADGAAALDKARRTVLASGLRMGEAVDIAEAPARIERQAAASALWIELGGAFGAPLERLLERVCEDVGHGRYSAIIAARAELIDPLTAKIGCADVDLVIDADDGERAAALSLAVALRSDRYNVHDVA